MFDSDYGSRHGHAGGQAAWPPAGGASAKPSLTPARGPQGRKMVAGGEAAEAQRRPRNPRYEARNEQRQWHDRPRDLTCPADSVILWRVPATELRMQHTCTPYFFGQAHHAIASKINSARRPSRSLCGSRTRIRGSALRPAGPCWLGPRLPSPGPVGARRRRRAGYSLEARN